MTPFNEIFDMFLRDIESEKLVDEALKDIGLFEDMLKDYLFESADLIFLECRQDLSKRDDDSFDAELTEQEKRILAKSMKIKWLDVNFIADERALVDRMTTKDYNIFSSSNRLRELNSTKDKWKHELLVHIRRYQYEHAMRTGGVR